jgi:hypothetical protein
MVDSGCGWGKIGIGTVDWDCVLIKRLGLGDVVAMFVDLIGKDSIQLFVLNVTPNAIDCLPQYTMHFW